MSNFEETVRLEASVLVSKTNTNYPNRTLNVNYYVYFGNNDENKNWAFLKCAAIDGNSSVTSLRQCVHKKAFRRSNDLFGLVTKSKNDDYIFRVTAIRTCNFSRRSYIFCVVLSELTLFGRLYISINIGH